MTVAGAIACLCGKQHGQNCGIRMTDQVYSDSADHSGHRAVGFGLHPGGAVLQAEVGQSGQQQATGCGTRALRQ